SVVPRRAPRSFHSRLPERVQKGNDLSKRLSGNCQLYLSECLHGYTRRLPAATGNTFSCQFGIEFERKRSNRYRLYINRSYLSGGILMKFFKFIAIPLFAICTIGCPAQTATPNAVATLIITAAAQPAQVTIVPVTTTVQSGTVVTYTVTVSGSNGVPT